MTRDGSPHAVALLGALVEERTGLSYAGRDLDLLAGKIMARAREVGFESALDYYYFLRYDPAGARELDALVDALVVVETYFFREEAGLRAAVEHVVVPAALRGDVPRVWSAACASGEEPLTIAMMLDEAGVLSRVRLVASDLSLAALALARARGYGPRSLRSTPAGALRYMRLEGDRARVEERLFDAIEWKQVNLIDAGAVRALGTFDLVVCRNVLIYFSDETVRRVACALAGRLRPGGRLLVGAAESLLRFGTIFECEERAGVFLYRGS